MSEWLTTGEMIDKLKIGEVAELKNTYVKGIEDIAYNAVIRDDEGFKWYRIDRDKKDSECFEINDVVINWEWRILPNYVSFEEAMKALREGKTVYCHREYVFRFKLDKEEAFLECDRKEGKGWAAVHSDINAIDILGNWTIENA
ncbi:hypothetical protein [Virgibacillus salexigens]|uniref:hypothetical protein n=1 Tax=Virgibacillus salexigens TaxID=61016 RepID=UPI0030814665